MIIDTTAKTFTGNHLEFPLINEFTTEPFNLKGFTSYVDQSGGSLLIFYFPSTVDPNVLVNNLSVTPKVDLLSRNRYGELYVWPTISWIPDTEFEITISSDLTDIHGNILENDTTFYIESAPMQVTWTRPYNNEHLIETKTYIAIEMNNVINEDSFQNALSIAPPTNYMPMFRYDNGETLIVLRADSLASNTEYTVSIDTTLKDYYGGSFKDGYSFKFMTK
jgi:hypothetical protein